MFNSHVNRIKRGAPIRIDTKIFDTHHLYVNTVQWTLSDSDLISLRQGPKEDTPTTGVVSRYFTYLRVYSSHFPYWTTGLVIYDDLPVHPCVSVYRDRTISSEWFDIFWFHRRTECSETLILKSRFLGSFMIGLVYKFFFLFHFVKSLFF